MTLTLEQLRALATTHGLALADDELGRLLPLVQTNRALMITVREALSPATEPVASVPPAP